MRMEKIMILSYGRIMIEVVEENKVIVWGDGIKIERIDDSEGRKEKENAVKMPRL